MKNPFNQLRLVKPYKKQLETNVTIRKLTTRTAMKKLAHHQIKPQRQIEQSASYEEMKKKQFEGVENQKFGEEVYLTMECQ